MNVSDIKTRKDLLTHLGEIAPDFSWYGHQKVARGYVKFHTEGGPKDRPEGSVEIDPPNNFHPGVFVARGLGQPMHSFQAATPAEALRLWLADHIAFHEKSVAAWRRLNPTFGL